MRGCDALSEADREEIWDILSDLFIDNEVDFECIARQLAAIERDPERIKRILFAEVAPCCGRNLMAVIPPIWSGFDRASLIDEIRKTQAQNRNSIVARWRHNMFARYCRWYFREDWRKLAATLARIGF
jgi:hypothetical protein